MPDVHNRKVRSYNMSRIRGINTQPEILVRNFLILNGFHFRLNDKMLPGKPDIVFRDKKIVVFVNGCFWHGHNNCCFARIPENNPDYWIPKLINNIIRDEQNKEHLKKKGWKVITIWQCGLKPNNQTKTLSSLLYKLSN